MGPGGRLACLDSEAVAVLAASFGRQHRSVAVRVAAAAFPVVRQHPYAAAVVDAAVHRLGHWSPES